MIELHQYPSIWNLSSLSPFCIKVAVFLERNNIPYRIVTEFNPKKGPKGKMPFIVDGSKTVADSSLIIDYLIQQYELKGYSEVEPQQQATALAFQRMIEEYLYFVLLYARWLEPNSWATVKREFSSLFPPLIGTPFMRFIRSNLRRQAIAQGLGRHSREEIYAIARRDLSAISVFLGKNRYFLGERWTPIDASLYAFLTTIVHQPVGIELKAILLEFPNLVDYCRRGDIERHDFTLEKNTKRMATNTQLHHREAGVTATAHP